jgi:hypothetical protein
MVIVGMVLPFSLDCLAVSAEAAKVRPDALLYRSAEFAAPCERGTINQEGALRRRRERFVIASVGLHRHNGDALALPFLFAFPSE